MLPTAIICALLLAAASSASAAFTEIAQTTHSSKASAVGSAVVFSRYDASTRRFRLVVVARDGVPRVLPIPSRTAPFDVDAGTDSDGHAVAVYSRCTREPEWRNAQFQGETINYNRASGCDLYMARLTSGPERRLANLSMGSASEFLPTISKGRVAFARRYTSRRGAAGVNPKIYLGSVGSTLVRLVRAGAQNGASSATRPISMDLSGRQLALVWSRETDSCRKSSGGDNSLNQPVATTAYLTTPGAAPRQMSTACTWDQEGKMSIAGIAWAGGRVIFATQHVVGDGQFGSTVTTIDSASRESSTRELLSTGDAFLRYLTTTNTGIVVTTTMTHGRDPVRTTISETPFLAP